MAQDWALAYRQFSNDYVAREGEAQEARLGMWREPWDWRREDRLVAAPAASRVEPTARRKRQRRRAVSDQGQHLIAEVRPA